MLLDIRFTETILEDQVNYLLQKFSLPIVSDLGVRRQDFLKFIEVGLIL